VSALPQRAQAASPAFVAGHLAVCTVTWGLSFVVMKLTRGEVDALTLSFLRGLFAAITIAALVLALRQSPLPERSEWRDWLVLGSVNGWIPNILVAFALERMAAGMASMVQAATPLVTAAFAHMLFADERLSRQRVLAALIGFAGTLLLIGPKLGQGGATTLAILAMLGVVFSYASGNLYARHRRAQKPERLALGQQVVSAIAAGALALPLMGLGATTAAMAAHGPALIVLGVLCTAVPIAFYMRLITRAGPTKASMISYLAPGAAVLMAVAVLGERLDPWQIVGGLVILVGVALMTFAPPARTPSPGAAR
jgi:drug/metabolite transporter (DMT)-like permease